MNYTENAINVMAAKTYKGVGRAWIVNNLSSPKSDIEIVDLLNISIKKNQEVTVYDFNRKKIILRQILAKEKNAMDGVVAIGDDNFPPYRGSVKNSEKPVFLFYRGNLSLLSIDSNNVAVIGLLNPSREIMLSERKVVAGLVKNNAVIVSGLALGCDSIAHIQTLDSNGKTVAILPSPLGNITPVSNKGLAEQIVTHDGLLVTEYLTNPKSKMEMNKRYQERDRLQALFSNSIILSASYAKNDIGNDSGSRLAMGYAKDYAIPRAVIYDHDKNLANPMFDLNRQIIDEDENVIVVNGKNRESTLLEILRSKPIIVDQTPVQQNMI